VTGARETAIATSFDLVGGSAQEAPGPVGRLERLPKWLNLIPMIVQWLWLSIRYGSWTLPAAANPQITAGGLVGEGKSEYFRTMGKLARANTADFAVFRNTHSSSAVEDAERSMAEAELAYPLILKPDIGWCGFGVRIVRTRDELKYYLATYPPNEDIVLQRFVVYEGEAGIYYSRSPHEARGRITGILLRFFPRVVGDGHSTISDLIARNPRARRLGRDGRSEPCCDISRIPSAGEIVRLSVTGSTRVGGMYQDATSLVTPELESAINEIALDMKHLHVARFDVRYETIGAMRAGHSFKIIEVNGAGSEAVHAWDPRYTLSEAYKIVFEKQRKLFAIGAAMRKRGHRFPSGWEIAKLYWRQERLIRRYPPSN
jgi:hypothetical protein